MKLLLTAFDPFGGSPINPALEAVKLVGEVAGAQIVKLEVPTVFGKSIETVAAAIQREQDNSDTAWLRKMGEALMAKGVTPPDNMLAAMGIDSSAAQQYINKIVGVYSGYVGGGGGGGGRPSGSQSGSPSDDRPVGTPTPTPTKTQTTQTNSTGYTGGKAYSNAVASQVYSLAASGNWSKAQSVLGEAYAAGQFSPQNYQTVYNRAQKKYFNYVNSKYKKRS